MEPFGRCDRHVLLFAGLVALLKALDHFQTQVKLLYEIYMTLLRLCV